MINVTDTLNIDESEIQFDFIRSSGPGGQNVNKVSTAVQLRWDVAATVAIGEEVKERLKKLAGSKLTEDGVLVIEAKRFRSQEKNRLDAIQRFVNLIQQALVEPKTRKKTRPTITASAARVATKKRRGILKRMRHYNSEDWE